MIVGSQRRKVLQLQTSNGFRGFLAKIEDAYPWPGEGHLRNSVGGYNHGQHRKIKLGHPSDTIKGFHDLGRHGFIPIDVFCGYIMEGAIFQQAKPRNSVEDTGQGFLIGYGESELEFSQA